MSSELIRDILLFSINILQDTTTLHLAVGVRAVLVVKAHSAQNAILSLGNASVLQMLSD